MGHGAQRGVYQCVNCDSKEHDIAGVRKRKACKTCNEITCWERIEETVDRRDMVPIEILESELDRVAVSDADGTDNMHIPNGNDTICKTRLRKGSWRFPNLNEVELTHDWCNDCRHRAVVRGLFE